MVSPFGVVEQLRAQLRSLQARNNRLGEEVAELRADLVDVRSEAQRYKEEAMGWHAAYAEKCNELEACRQGKKVDSGG